MILLAKKAQSTAKHRALQQSQTAGTPPQAADPSQGEQESPAPSSPSPDADSASSTPAEGGFFESRAAAAASGEAASSPPPDAQDQKKSPSEITKKQLTSSLSADGSREPSTGEKTLKKKSEIQKKERSGFFAKRGDKSKDQEVAGAEEGTKPKRGFLGMFFKKQPSDSKTKKVGDGEAVVDGKDDTGCSIYRFRPSDPIVYDSEFKQEEIKKSELIVPGAFVLDNVLTRKECQQYIDISEGLGFEDAPIFTATGPKMAKDFRDNKRVMWNTDLKTWHPIWSRVQHLVPQEIIHEGTWKPIGLNERFRFYRYQGDETFRTHKDGYYPRKPDEISFVTFIIYLNDGFEGGWTTFFVRKDPVRVSPKAGSVLLFFHGRHELSPLHEGSSLKGSGSKYVLRSDVMYRRTAATGTREVEDRPPAYEE